MALVLAAAALARLEAQTAPPSDPRIDLLIEQNRALQDTVAAQQKRIDELTARLDRLAEGTADQQKDLKSLQARIVDGTESAAAPPRAESAGEYGAPSVRISGEFGSAFFLSGQDGMYSKGEFRVDEARVFLDAVVFKDIYAYTDIDLVTRETTDQNLHFGEAYIDMEDVASGVLGDRLLNVRTGRFYTPFGEDYQVRGIMANPLISHSESDIWGMDGGVEAYGSGGHWSYAASVQDGGIRTLNTAHSDKSVALRLGYDPAAWIHLSASGARTGRINQAGDFVSALWISNGFFRAIGPAATTQTFYADLGEADIDLKARGATFRGSAGVIRTNDDNPAGGDARTLRFFSAEGTYSLTPEFYGAARFSGISAPGGYPLAGQGQVAEYSSSSELTTGLYRLSFGVGYRIGPPVVLKLEYSPEWGRTANGENRDSADLFSTELGVRF